VVCRVGGGALPCGSRLAARVIVEGPTLGPREQPTRQSGTGAATHLHPRGRARPARQSPTTHTARGNYARGKGREGGPGPRPARQTTTTHAARALAYAKASPRAGWMSRGGLARVGWAAPRSRRGSRPRRVRAGAHPQPRPRAGVGRAARAPRRLRSRMRRASGAEAGADLRAGRVPGSFRPARLWGSGPARSRRGRGHRRIGPAGARSRRGRGRAGLAGWPGPRPGREAGRRPARPRGPRDRCDGRARPP
jgi:hypothetical protein